MKLISLRKNASVAFLGLGNMGYQLAGHLKKKGYKVTVYNRSEAKSKSWAAKYGGDFAPTVEEAVKNADAVVCCVGDDDDLEMLAIGKHGKSGAFEVMKRGAFFIDHTTASSTLAKRLNDRALQKGLNFVDAPVSGGKIGAKNGNLTAFCGCMPEHFEVISRFLKVYCKKVSRVGGPGCGQLAKMVNQICSAGALRGIAEGIEFGKKAGLDMQALLHAMSFGSASSWQMAHRGHKMIKGSADVDFAVELLNKDLKLALQQAVALELDLELTKIVQRDCEFLSNLGYGSRDTHNISRCVAKLKTHQ